MFNDHEPDLASVPGTGTAAAAQKLWSLDLRAVQIFLTIAAERSFRRAAERLRLSPASVSHAVAKLERHLGVRLFDRSTRAVTVTADGRALIGPACALLRAAERLGAEASDRAGRATLRIGTMFGLHADVIHHAASSPAETDQSDIELASFGWGDPTCGLRDAEVDAAILVGPTDHDDMLVRRSLYHTPMMAIVPADSSLAGRDAVDRTALDACGWARVETSDATWRGYWRLDHVRGAPPQEHPATHASPAALFFAVRAGRGVATTIAASRRHFDLEGLTLIQVRGVDPVPVDIAHRRDRTAPAIERFARLMIALSGCQDPAT